MQINPVLQWTPTLVVGGKNWTPHQIHWTSLKITFQFKWKESSWLQAPHSSKRQSLTGVRPQSKEPKGEDTHKKGKMTKYKIYNWKESIQPVHREQFFYFQYKDQQSIGVHFITLICIFLFLCILSNYGS